MARRAARLFLDAMADLLNRENGWDVKPSNIAITAGGQTAFFFLFNMLAGECAGGVRKRILLPLAPEYIGYANQGMGDGMFDTRRPKIEQLGEHTFKYRVDFENLTVGDDRRRHLRLATHQPERQCPDRRRDRPAARDRRRDGHPADHRQRLRHARSRTRSSRM